MQSKKIFWLLLAIGIVVLGVIVYSLSKSKPSEPLVVQQSQDDLKPNVTDPAQLPERFPSNFPLEEGAEVTQNYSAGKDGYFQSTRAFTSNKTSAENFKIYEDFFTDAGWNIVVRLDQPGIKTVAATQGTTRAKVDIVDDETSKQTNVNITVEYK